MDSMILADQREHERDAFVILSIGITHAKNSFGGTNSYQLSISLTLG